MNTLKKAFRGYRRADVDELLHNLESQLESSLSRCTALEKQLADANAAVEKARQDISKMEEKLAESETKSAKTNQEYERLRTDISQKQNQAEAIGGIYIKAFENGREIIESSKTHTERFLANIETATEKAGFNFSAVEKEFVDTSGTIDGLITEIHRQIDFLKQRLMELTSHAGAIGAAYRNFEHVKSEVNADIGEIQRDYDQMLSDFLSSSNRTVSFSGDVPPQEPPTTAEILPEKQISELEPVPVADVNTGAEQTTEIEDTVQSFKQQLPESDSGVNVPEDGSRDQTEFTDTAADFRDEKDSTTEAKSEEAMGKIKEKKEEAARGQNIMNLLSKYQKR